MTPRGGQLPAKQELLNNDFSGAQRVRLRLLPPPRRPARALCIFIMMFTQEHPIMTLSMGSTRARTDRGVR
jgi:hypothetical protein